MNISRESTGELTATIRVEILPEDYTENVSKILKDYQKKANIPGFRPGKVPAGMIRKMYGKAILADEVNKLVSKALSDHIEEEKLELIGYPIPNREKNNPVHFDEEIPFEFYFDIGLTPAFQLELSALPEIPHYKIRVDDEMLDKYIDETLKRHGNYSHPEKASENDMLNGELTELNEEGKPLEGGITKTAYFSLDRVKQDDARKKLMDLAKDGMIRFRPVEFFGNIEDATTLLVLTTAQLENNDHEFELKVTDIMHNQPAELNQELFEKVYPGQNIDTEEQFREKVREDAAAGFTAETDKFLFHMVNDTLLKEIPISLPEEFLKRWIRDNNEKNYTDEEIEKEFPSFAGSMKWQLIENRLIRDNQIEVKEQDIRDYIKKHMLRQISLESADPETEKRYESIVDALMQNKEQVQRINDQLYSQRLVELFKTKMNLDTKEVSYEEFVTLASQHSHEHEHEHEHELDHEHEH